MANYIIQDNPFIVPTDDGKVIKEHFGLTSDRNPDISIAHMKAPAGWSEPFQTPQFDEYTLILKGKKQFIIEDETVVLEAGQSIKINKNSKVQYSNPFMEVCEYISVCIPAFSLDLVNREKES